MKFIKKLANRICLLPDLIDKKIRKNISMIKAKPYFFIALILLISVFIGLMIIISYWIGSKNYSLIHTNLSLGDALGFYGSILTFAGTIVLGACTVILNKRTTDIAEISLRNELNSKIPDVIINYDKSIKIEDCLFTQKNLNEMVDNQIIYANVVNDDGFYQYGYIPLNVILNSGDAINEFKLESITINDLKQRGFFRLEPCTYINLHLSKKDNKKNYYIGICADYNNETFKQVFAKKSSFLISFTFSFYNILNKRLELKSTYIYINEFLYTIEIQRPEYKEKK